MKAIKVTQPFKVEIVEVEKPKIQKSTDVLIKITSGGICGSDIGIYNGSNSLATYPRIIGHEFGGKVAEVGSGVTRVRLGDKVAVDPVVSCGHCYACKIGRHNVCSTLEVMGVHRDGGFAEYIVVDEANAHTFATDFDEKLLAMVEPYTIGEEINNRAQIAAGDKVLVMGAGPIGVCAMQVAKSRGAQVIITDAVAKRLAKAKAMGADETVLIGQDDLEKRLLGFTDGEGIPVVVDTVCSTASFEQSMQLACPAGRVVVLGLKAQPASIKMAEITKKELTIVGSRLSNHCFDDVIAAFEAGTLTPQELCTQQYPYTEAEAAIKQIVERPQEVLKVALKFD